MMDNIKRTASRRNTWQTLECASKRCEIKAADNDQGDTGNNTRCEHKEGTCYHVRGVGLKHAFSLPRIPAVIVRSGLNLR